MRKFITGFALVLAVISTSNPVPRHSFLQANNINTVFINNGIFNYDWWTFPTYDAGFVWPVAPTQRMTADYATGIYISAKVNGQLRASGSLYASYFTGGNIPVPGGVPPLSVCNDSAFKVYLVSLTDESLVNGGTRFKQAGGRQYTFNYVSWAAWPVNQGAPYYELNGIPGYQPGWTSDRPGIGNSSTARPDQLLFTVYMDYTNCTNNVHNVVTGLPGGTLPMGIEIHQLAFAFNCVPLENTYFTKYRLINKSGQSWDSVYFGLINDADIGAGSCGASDDATGTDTMRNMVFQYNADNYDCNYGINPPALGTRFLQSPIRFTGNLLDTAKLPYRNFVGYKLVGLTGTAVFLCGGPPCTCQPDNATEAFNLLKGFDICGNPHFNYVTGQPTKFMYTGNACQQTGWIDSTSRDKSYLMSSGPFTMMQTDTQVIVISFSITREGNNNFQNLCSLLPLSDTALKYYFNDFQTCIPIGIQPISNEVPDRFALYQNYPNPFNPVTSIKFSIPSLLWRGAGVVLLKVYDILGREITTLVNEELKPGIYEVEFNGADLSSGIYFYTITSNNFFSSRRMVLLK